MVPLIYYVHHLLERFVAVPFGYSSFKIAAKRRCFLSRAAQSNRVYNQIACLTKEHRFQHDPVIGVHCYRLQCSAGKIHVT